MKRSRSVPLSLFSVATAAALASCGDDTPAQPPTFTSVQACVDAGGAREGCQAAYDKAMAEHVAKAPRYDTEDACKRGVDVDRCVRTQVRRDDGSLVDVFLPAMAGYMLGKALSDNNRRDDGSRYGGTYGGYTYGNSGPVYRSGTGSGYRPQNGLAYGSPASLPRIDARPPSSSWGSMTVKPSTAPSGITAPSRPSNVGTVAISRGGFSGMGGGFGGGSS